MQTLPGLPDLALTPHAGSITVQNIPCPNHTN